MCIKFGDIAGRLQENFITLEDKRGDWLDINAILNKSFFDKIATLISVLTLFATTGIVLDNILKD